MTANLLKPSLKSTKVHQSALSIIDAYRDVFADMPTLVSLDSEFPYLKIDDKDSIYLFDAGNNLAGAFKWRGALVGASALPQGALVVPSAGNHARGSVLAAKALGKSIDVVVPVTAPPAKREGLRKLWDDERNRVHVFGETFDESLAYAYKLAELRGGALLHPYDNKDVIKGQGTIVDDLLQTRDDVDHVVLPVGGGGLLAGVLDRLRELGREDIHVTAVEAPGSNSLSRSLVAKKVAMAKAPNQAYGGSAVKFIGHLPLRSAMRYPNLRVVTAREADITNVIATYQKARNDLMRTNAPFEPTSIVAVAGLYRMGLRKYSNTVVIGTGHNAPLGPL